MRIYGSRGTWRLVPRAAVFLTALLTVATASAAPASALDTLAAPGTAAAGHADACAEPGSEPVVVDARSGRGPAQTDPASLSPAQVALRERGFARDQRLRQAGPSAQTTVTIPVVFHIISRDGTRATGNIPDSMITAQMQVLNNAYAGVNGGVATEFTFTLQEINRVTSSAWSPIWPRSSNEAEMKAALRRGGMETLNIYTGHTNGPASYGWSTFPQATFSTNDGVVLQHETLPGGNAAPYDQGDTAVHEIGHWLNLYHTFQNGCENGGDQVADTPDEAYPNYDCGTSPDTCPTAGVDPIQNYMDYTEDACIYEFTAGQAQRMSAAWTTYRAP